MTSTPRIEFIKNSSEGKRARYALSGHEVPAAAMTRLMDKLENLGERQQERAFIAALVGKYEGFLNALDEAQLTVTEAIPLIRSLSAKPEKTRRTPKRVNLARQAAKVMCKVFGKGTPAEVVETFLQVVGAPGFREDAVACVAEMEDSYGRNPAGKIRTQPARPASADNARKARESRQAKK